MNSLRLLRLNDDAQKKHKSLHAPAMTTSWYTAAIVLASILTVSGTFEMPATNGGSALATHPAPPQHFY